MLSCTSTFVTISDISREDVNAITIPLPPTVGVVLPSNLKSPVTRTNGPRGRDQSALPSRELFFRETRQSARFPACVYVYIYICCVCVCSCAYVRYY